MHDSKVTELIKNKNITLVFPYRKNQHNKNTNKEKKLLDKRFTIEQLFSTLKRTYGRLKLLCDRKLANYECFLIMAFSCQILKSIQ